MIRAISIARLWSTFNKRLIFMIDGKLREEIKKQIPIHFKNSYYAVYYVSLVTTVVKAKIAT